MTRPAADRVKAIWTGTGTGTITLGGAASGEPVQAFPSELNGQVVRYLIKHDTAQQAEAGYGVYTHSGTTLTRLYRTYPTRGGAAVSFSSGTKFVAVTPVHLDFVPELSTINPSATDDISTGYLMGHIWINTTSDTCYMCVDHTDNAAVWANSDSAGSAVTVDQNDILARLTAGSGVTVGVAAGDLTEDATPGAGDFILGWSGGTLLRKFDIGDLPNAADAAPSLVTSNAATFVLAEASRLHNNVDVTSHQASVVFEVPQAASASSKWLIMPQHDGCTVTINGGVGTLTPSTSRLVNGGLAVVHVRSNPGTAPVVEVRGEVIVPPTAVTTKTYDADDHGQDFVATGTQTFNTVVASLPNGYYVNIKNGNLAATITIDGIDSDHVVPASGVVLVKKWGASLVCNGSGGDTVLDAA